MPRSRRWANRMGRCIDAGDGMSDDERLVTLMGKIEAGQMSYDDAADLFELTAVGRSARAPRAQVLERLRRRFADEAALNAFLRHAYGRYAAAVDRSRAS